MTLAQAEARVAELEARVAELDAALADPARHADFARLGKEREAAARVLAEAEAVYLELYDA